jgi:putative transposase
MQNAYCESFNGRMRDELLNESLFFGLDHARAKTPAWVDDYNQCHPLSALGYQTWTAYTANLNAMADQLRNPDQIRRSAIAPPAPAGAQSAETLIATGSRFSGRSTPNEFATRSRSDHMPHRVQL